MRTLPFIALTTLTLSAAWAFAQEGDPKKKGDSTPPVAQEDAQDDSDAKGGEWAGEPYLLETCALSGNPLDMKGTRTTKVMFGRELKFCCGGCAGAMEKDPAKWAEKLEKVDEAMMAQQRPIYPTTECIVAGEDLMEDGEFTGKEVLVGNRLFRVCCARCVKKVEADPKTYADKLDAMVLEAAAEEDGYPLENCVVQEKKKLDDKARALVVAGRPVKVCCSGCVRKVRAKPAKYVAKVDEALAEARAEAAKKDAAKDDDKKAKDADEKDADKKRGKGGDGK